MLSLFAAVASNEVKVEKTGLTNLGLLNLSRLPIEESPEVAQFRAMDGDTDGRVTRAEVKSAVASELSVTPTDEHLDMLLGHGVESFVLARLLDNPQWLSAWKKFVESDTDQDGVLSLEEAQNASLPVSSTGSGGVTLSEMMEVIGSGSVEELEEHGKTDGSGDGKVDYDELVTHVEEVLNGTGAAVITGAGGRQAATRSRRRK